MNETKIPFNRLNDVYVKALLGDEHKKNLTLDFINTTLERTGGRADYHHIYAIQDIETQETLTEQLEMHFVELEKVRISDIKKVKQRDAWFLYFSPRCIEAERRTLAMKNSAIKKAIDYEELFHGDKDLWYAYEQNEKAIKDYNSLLDTGRTEGERRATMDFAISLLKDKVPFAKITQWTKLSEAEIRQIAKENELEICEK